MVLINPNFTFVFVDGTQHDVDDGNLTVACGKHRILGKRVDVPCGGTVSLRHPPPFSPKTGWAYRFQGGLGQRTLFHDSILGVDLTASIGGYVDNVDVFLDLQMLFGWTNGGLPVRQTRVGPSIDAELFSRVRLGAGLSLGGTSISRVTNDTTLDAFSAGARVFGSVDVWRPGEHAAVYLLGQLSIDSAGVLSSNDHDGRQSVPSATIWGPTIGVGARF